MVVVVAMEQEPSRAHVFHRWIVTFALMEAKSPGVESVVVVADRGVHRCRWRPLETATAKGVPYWDYVSYRLFPFHRASGLPNLRFLFLFFYQLCRLFLDL